MIATKTPLMSVYRCHRATETATETGNVEATMMGI